MEGPVDEDTVALEDVVGELVVSGSNVMAGYYRLPEANDRAFTVADGTRWFHTGDLGYWDEDDYFYIVDREKHVIITGGYNVYPREVEEVLYEHEAVGEAAVIGIEDDRRGETVKALIVPVPGFKPGIDMTKNEIREYVLANLAEYKHPRIIEFCEELTRTTTGKVQKYALRQKE